MSFSRLKILIFFFIFHSKRLTKQKHKNAKSGLKLIRFWFHRCLVKFFFFQKSFDCLLIADVDATAAAGVIAAAAAAFHSKSKFGNQKSSIYR